jgi:hypothetical protein
MDGSEGSPADESDGRIRRTNPMDEGDKHITARASARAFSFSHYFLY